MNADRVATLDWCAARDVRVVVSRLRLDLASTLAGYGLLDRLEVYDTSEDAVLAVQRRTTTIDSAIAAPQGDDS